MPDGLERHPQGGRLSGIEIETIEATQTFRDFEDYWTSQAHTFQHPVSKSIAALSDADREKLRDLMRKTLPAAADGGVTYPARATAFKARKAQ